MQGHSILAGKTYRTADDELRRVLRLEGDDVIYNAVSSTPGFIARQEEQRMSVEQFAGDAEGETVAS